MILKATKRPASFARLAGVKVFERDEEWQEFQAVVCTVYTPAISPQDVIIHQPQPPLSFSLSPEILILGSLIARAFLILLIIRYIVCPKAQFMVGVPKYV